MKTWHTDAYGKELTLLDKNRILWCTYCTLQGVMMVDEQARVTYSTEELQPGYYEFCFNCELPRRQISKLEALLMEYGCILVVPKDVQGPNTTLRIGRPLSLPFVRVEEIVEQVVNQVGIGKCAKLESDANLQLVIVFSFRLGPWTRSRLFRRLRRLAQPNTSLTMVDNRLTISLGNAFSQQVPIGVDTVFALIQEVTGARRVDSDVQIDAEQ